jgi:hypothetical protein
MELENITLSEVSQTQKSLSQKSDSLICEYKPNKMHQYYATMVTLRGSHTLEG